LAQESLAILEKAEGPDHPHLAYPVREIGKIHMAQKRYGEAEPFLRRSLEIRRKELPAGHPEIARAKTLLGSCLAELGRDGEAMALLREANATFATQHFSHDESAQQARVLLAKLEKRR
jgi:Flp pilus assembly protein TadD